jgi:hypothetical protein
MSLNIIFSFFLFLPFIPILFPYGTYQESDLAIAGIWCAGGLSAIYYGLKRKITLTPISAMWIAMSALSLLGILQNKLGTLTGINDIREGTFTFFAICMCIVFCKEHINKTNFSFWIFPLAYGVITVLGFYGWRDFGWKTYNFLDVYGFAMLASLPMYIDFRQKITQKILWDCAYTSCFALLLFYCDNKALNLACVVGLFFVFVWPIIKNKLSSLPKKDGIYVASGLVVLSIFILLSWFFFRYLPLQLQSRTMLAIVTILHFFDHFSLKELFHLIFGYGWGSYQQFPVLNIFQLDHFTVYTDNSYKPNWEFLERNLLHSHNIVIETFISAGLLGVSLLTYGIYKVTNHLSNKDYIGRFYWVSFLLLYSAWFQMPTTIPFTVMAMALMKEDISFNFKLPKIPTCLFGIFLITFACWDFYASYKLVTRAHENIKTFANEMNEFLTDKSHAYDQWTGGKCSNYVMGNATATLSKFDSAKDSKYVADIELSVIAAVEDFMKSPQNKNLVTFVHLINLCNALANLKNNQVQLSKKFDAVFKELVLQFLILFPSRADMAMGYLNWKFDILHDFTAAEIMANGVLNAYPNHPLGLAIKSLIGLSRGENPQPHKNSLIIAIKSGLNRFMPVPPEMLQALGIQK